MVGANLTRFSGTPFVLFDTETTGLNLHASRPWQLSFAVATLKGIESVYNAYIQLPEGCDISDDAARVTRFDRDRYNREAKPAQEVWDAFIPYLYNPAYRKAGHNILGYDIAMVSTFRRVLGLRPDHSWQFDGGGALDTNALSKAYQKGWTMDISSPIALVSSQMKALDHVEKGLKSSLGFMCGQLGIPYDEHRAHDAAYDCGINYSVLRELVFKMEI